MSHLGGIGSTHCVHTYVGAHTLCTYVRTYHPRHVSYVPPDACMSLHWQGTQDIVGSNPLDEAVVVSEETKMLHPEAPFICPEALIDYFIRYAAKNTRKNREALAYITGVVHTESTSKKEVFFARALFIPEQIGRGDSCEQTSSMEGYFNFLADHDFVQIGWIHTHPKHDNFLSSVDYQLG